MTALRKITGVAAAFLISLTIAQSASGESRTIPLEGVKNTRDLGGLTTTDVHVVRPGQIIRSGELDHISATGKQRLDELGVTAVIDLRNSREAGASPATWPSGTGPERYNFHLLENESDLIDDMRARISSGSAEATWMDQTFKDTFGYIPTDYSTEIRRVFDVLLQTPEGEAILIHCSGGKDRTGVVSALILASLGVPRDQIEEDFLQSNVLINADEAAAEMAAAINAQRGTKMRAEDVWPSLGVRPEYFAYFYDTLEAEYGGANEYLRKALKLTDNEIAALRARYLQ